MPMQRLPQPNFDSSHGEDKLKRLVEEEEAEDEGSDGEVDERENLGKVGYDRSSAKDTMKKEKEDSKAETKGDEEVKLVEIRARNRSRKRSESQTGARRRSTRKSTSDEDSEATEPRGRRSSKKKFD